MSELRKVPRAEAHAIVASAPQQATIDAPEESASIDSIDTVEEAKPNPFSDAVATRAPIVPQLDSAPAKPAMTEARMHAIDAFGEKANTAETGYDQAQAIAHALRNESSLGKLSDAEAKYLVETSVDRWQQGPNTNYAAARHLAYEVANDPRSPRADLVALAFAEKATHIEQPDRAFAATLAAEAALIARTPQNARKLIDTLGPDESRALVNALALKPERLLGGGSVAFGTAAAADTRVVAAQVLLDGAAYGKTSQATKAIVDTTFATLGDATYARGFGRTGDSMAKALAHHWYAGDLAKQRSEGARLSQILSSDQGRELISNDHLSLEARLQNLELVKSHPSWDAKFFESTDHVFDNAEVVMALAAPTAAKYTELRGDAPQTLAGSDLENIVGFAMALEPTNTNIDEAAAGKQSLFEGESSERILKPVTDAIRNVGGAEPKVTILPIQYASAETGPVTLPLFRVQDKAGGADKFVDNIGRTYSSFEDWKENNQLPPGNMVYSEGGHLQSSFNLKSSNTPQTVDSAGEYAAVGLDYAALAGGTIAGGAVILGSGGTAAPVVIAAASVWGLGRAGEQLYDRSAHDQSIDPLHDAGARGAWIGIGANALSLASLGATGLAGRLAQTGSRLAFPAATAAGYLRAGGNILDAAAAANATHTLLAHWDELKPQDRASLMLSASFWGVSTFAGAKLGGVKTSAMFNPRAMRNAILFEKLDPKVRTTLEASMKANAGAGDRALADLTMSPLFRSMSANEQAQFLAKNSSAVIELSAAPGFKQLAPGAQRNLIENWAQLPQQTRGAFTKALAGPEQAKLNTLTDVASSPAFRNLNTADQVLLLKYASGDNAQLSQPARTGLRQLLDDPAFTSASPADQSTKLRAFLDAQPASQPVLRTPQGAFAKKAKVKISEPKPVPSFAFDSGAAPANKYELTIEGKKIDVYMSKQNIAAGLEQHYLDEVTDSLRRLPKDVRAQIKEVRVDSGAAPGDAFWQKKFNNPDHRAYMTADSQNQVVNIHPTTVKPKAEDAIGSLVHEVGHFRSDGAWGADSENGAAWAPWRTAIASDRIRSSKYASGNPGEDFAETYKLYYQVKGTPQEREVRALMPDRFRILDELAKKP